MSVRVRFPPSPTGFLHIGGLRTALYNYLFAKQNNGAFILRIEDTDQQRLVEGATEALLDIFPRMGIVYDEGPKIFNGTMEQVGEHGPYIQSMRLSLYREYADALLKNAHAYRCFCTQEALKAERKHQELLHMPTKYNRRCLSLTKEEREERLEKKDAYVVRMRVPEGETVFEDVIRGRICILNTEIDDQILLKSDGFPTYHLANVVDDHLMEITHVIRGEEWITSTPKHILLYRMFSWQPPQFAHLPLLLNSDRSKLSKRQGDVAAEDYLKKGYLPEALLNFLYLLGFNPKGDQEIYTMQEMIDLFELSKVNPSGAVVNREKLDWINQHYMKEKAPEELAELCKPFLEEAGKRLDEAMLARILAVERERMTTLADIVERIDLYTNPSEYPAERLIWKKGDREDAKKHLNEVKSLLESLPGEDFTKEGLEEALKSHISTHNYSNGNVLWPLRVALSGQEQSPGPFELGWVLQKEEVVKRVQTAIKKLT